MIKYIAETNADKRHHSFFLNIIYTLSFSTVTCQKGLCDKGQLDTVVVFAQRHIIPSCHFFCLTASHLSLCSWKSGQRTLILDYLDPARERPDDFRPSHLIKG